VTATVAAIVLAAGASRRLGQPKQLLTYKGESLIERAVRLASEAGAAPLLAVLGANREMILAAVNLNGAVSVINNNWEKGIATSIHAGLESLDGLVPHVNAALILSCDQPRLTVDHLRELIEAYAAQAEPSIVASAYAGVVGIPAIFPRPVFHRLLALRGDQGARAILAQPRCPLIPVPFSGGEVDIDQPEDLAQLE
jgi:molybdenum cofactor cytidylyltransferase